LTSPRTLPLDNMIANAQLLAPTKITVTRMMFPTRHQHSLNGLKPGPHTCHKQNLLQRHRLVERGIELPCQFPLTVNAATATSKTAPVVTQTTPPVLLTESHIRLLIAVLGITLLVGNGITHQHSGAIVCHPSSAPPLLASPPFEEHLFVLTGLEHCQG